MHKPDKTGEPIYYYCGEKKRFQKDKKTIRKIKFQSSDLSYVSFSFAANEFHHNVIRFSSFNLSYHNEGKRKEKKNKVSFVLFYIVS